MATSGRRTTGAATAGVGMVAITAAVISFSHVRAVALHAGESVLTSWLLPISIDGAVVAAASVLLADSRAGRRPATLAWMLLSLGIGASLAANIASAEPTATARAVAAWPPIALALGIELLAGLARRSDAAQADQRDVSGSPVDTGRPERSPGSVNGFRTVRPDAGGRPGTLPSGTVANDSRRSPGHSVDDEHAIRLIRELDMASPDGRASRLQIQKKLRCGGSRAARLATLARCASVDGAL